MFIDYSYGDKKYYATKNRPEVQNKKRIHEKIAKQSFDFILEHSGANLTQLQRDLVKFLSDLAVDQDTSLTDLNVGINILISQMIDLFVEALNDRRKLDAKAFFGVSDDLTKNVVVKKNEELSIRSFVIKLRQALLKRNDIIKEVNEILENLYCVAKLSYNKSSENGLSTAASPVLLLNRTELPILMFKGQTAQVAAPILDPLIEIDRSLTRSPGR